jgi:hypothetical protein
VKAEPLFQDHMISATPQALQMLRRGSVVLAYPRSGTISRDRFCELVLELFRMELAEALDHCGVE